MNKPNVWLYYLLKPFLSIYIKVVYNPKIINKDYIPEDGPVITAGNHHRLVMEAMMVALATKRTLRFLAKKEHFEGFKKFFFKNVGCVPVDRNNKDENAKQVMINLLNEGNIVNIFPEGTRNNSGEPLLPLKFGVVSFAQKTGATIAPYAFRSSWQAFKYDTVLEFGKPFKSSGDLEQDNQRLREEILKIINK